MRRSMFNMVDIWKLVFDLPSLLPLLLPMDGIYIYIYIIFICYYIYNAFLLLPFKFVFKINVQTKSSCCESGLCCFIMFANYVENTRNPHKCYERRTTTDERTNGARSRRPRRSIYARTKFACQSNSIMQPTFQASPFPTINNNFCNVFQATFDRQWHVVSC